MTPRDPRWQAARRILCVRPGGLGAVLLCTPALRALRAAAPACGLTLLASPAGTAALPFIPELDDAIACRSSWLTGAMAQPCTVEAVEAAEAADAALAATLAARAFDAAVIFTSYTQDAGPAALACRRAGIPLQLAYCRGQAHGLLSDPVADLEPATLVRHEVMRQLALVERLAGAADGAAHAGSGAAVGHGGAGLGLSFAVRPTDIAAVRERLRAAGIAADAPWLLLHPGAGAAARRYPAALWARLMRLLHEAPALPLVLAGSAAEAGLVDAIRAAAGVPAVSLAGQSTLGELGAALHLAALAIGNDAAPVHIAAAVGTPVVALYALTRPQYTPWNAANRVLFHDVPCRFCHARACPAGHHACLAGVAPERAAAAVLALLGKAPRRRTPAAAAGRAEPVRAPEATDSGPA